MNTDALPRLAFIHIPKTAGTSVRERLAGVYGDATFPGMTTLDYPCYSDEQLAAYRFYSGHAYRRDFTRLPADTVMFTVLRDPVARAISLYRYFRAIEVSEEDRYTWEAAEIARNSGIVEFIHSNNPVLVEHLRAGQIRQLIATDLLDEIGHRRSLTDALERGIWDSFVEAIGTFAYVFTLDWLEVSLDVMSRELGLPADGASLPRANVSPCDCAIDEIAVRRAVYDVSPLDCRAYDLARRRENRFLQARFRILSGRAAETHAPVAAPAPA